MTFLGTGVQHFSAGLLPIITRSTIPTTSALKITLPGRRFAFLFPMRFTLGLIILLSLSSQASELTTPRLTRMNRSYFSGTPFRIDSINRPVRCEDLFNEDFEDLVVRGERLSEAANIHFKRRNWSEKFLKSRTDIIRRYAQNTSGFAVVQEGLAAPENTKGTINVTWAHYDLNKSKVEFLPEEETLGIRLDRPQTKSRRGFIFEIRTYSMDREVNVEIFAGLLEQTLAVIIDKIKDHPELYEAPIIHTYGDRAGRLLYRPLGFDFTRHTPEDQPIEAYDIKWWSLVTTPRQLEKLLLQLRSHPDMKWSNEEDRWITPHPTIHDFNQDFPAPLPGAPDAMAAAHSHIAYDDEGRPASTILAQDTRFSNGMVAAKGSHVVQFYGKLAIVSKIAEDFNVPSLGVMIPAGSKLTFGSANVVGVENSPTAWQISPGVFARAGQTVLFNERTGQPKLLPY